MNSCMFTYTLVQLCSWYDLIITTFVVANQCYTKCAWIEFKHSHIHTRERALNKERNREEKTSSKNTAQRLLAQSALLTCSRSQWLSEFALTFTHTLTSTHEIESERYATLRPYEWYCIIVFVCVSLQFTFGSYAERRARERWKNLSRCCMPSYLNRVQPFSTVHIITYNLFFFLLLYSHYKRDATSR